MTKYNFWEEVKSSLLHSSSNSIFYANCDYYVPLVLVKEEAGNSYKKQEFEYKVFLQQVLERESQSDGRRIALIGKPEAGKTITLRNISLWILEKELGLPIWISAKSLTENENLIDLEIYLFENWIKHLFSPSLQAFARQDLRFQVEQGRVWLLLDGIDFTIFDVEILEHISQQLKGVLGKSTSIINLSVKFLESSV